MAERLTTEPEPKRRPIHKIGIVLYALFMAFVQSHYITAQLYPNSEYFVGVWLGVSDAQLMTGEALAIFANIGLLLSPFLAAPRPAMRLLMLASLAAGAIVATVHLVHIFSIYVFLPFWPSRPIDGIYIKMFIESLMIYAIDLLAIYLYLSKLKRLHAFRKRELREESR
ncbi:MAG: hypothetical protein ACREJ0_15435 [Geminicoccaceae bacterium]